MGSSGSAVGVAVVGVGYWGPNLLRNLNSAAGCDVKIVCDRSAEALGSVSSSYPGVGLVSELNDVLSSSAVDAVVVATPASTHCAIARRVLESGRSVFVEKPLASSTAECDELIELAERVGKTLMVGHTFEYNGAVEYVEKLIHSGELGEVYYVYSQRLNLGVVRQDVNALWSLAPHDVSITLRWLRSEPTRVRARGYTYLQEGVEDVVYLDLEFSNGVSSHIHVGWLDPCKVRRSTVVGSKKMVVYDDVSTEAKIQVYDKGIDRQHTGDSLGEFDSFGKFQLTQRAGDVLIPKIEYAEPLKSECQHFIDSILSGEAPRTDGANGRRVVRVLEAATKSLELDGSVVEL